MMKYHVAIKIKCPNPKKSWYYSLKDDEMPGTLPTRCSLMLTPKFFSISFSIVENTHDIKITISATLKCAAQ